MARPLRIEYEGAIYHVMNRGDRRQGIFRRDADRVIFLETLASASAKTQWQVHAYCLMSNHFHLVLETPRANLVAGMKWLLGTYTMRGAKRGRAVHMCRIAGVARPGVIEFSLERWLTPRRPQLGSSDGRPRNSTGSAAGTAPRPPETAYVL